MIIEKQNTNEFVEYMGGIVMSKYDKIIIGAGLYGLYAAEFCCRRGEHVLVLECDPTPFRRATFIY